MVDPSQIPYLLQLLDDESPAVQDAVRYEFEQLGSRLDEEIVRQGITLTAHQEECLHWLRTDTRRNALVEAWPSWFRLPDDKAKLEAALALISEYQDPNAREGRLSELLNTLADEYAHRFDDCDSYTLARFLFKQKRLEGAQEDYYNPRNSDLAYVIEEGRGIPISLACVYILVGRRLGVDIEGCNFPGHFLARTTVGKDMVLVDCFNGGRFIDARSFQQFSPAGPLPQVSEIVEARADAPVIVGRVLNNLANAYTLHEDAKNSGLMQELLQLLRGHLEAR